MTTLSALSGLERGHWELHLKAAQKDLPDNKDIARYLGSKQELPSIKHPAYMHDWLEQPERRTEIEAWNG